MIILVTGGAGHVGSHIIEMLVKDPKNKVISLDNYFNGSTENHIDGAEYRKGHTKEKFYVCRRLGLRNNRNRRKRSRGWVYIGKYQGIFYNGNR